MPTYHEGDKRIHIESWGSHVDKMIREAQARGEFDNVPGMGQPLHLEGDNPFNSEWSAAFRVAKNAGAAPLWVQLDKEIGADGEALRAMLERTARYLEGEASRIRGDATTTAPPAPPATPGSLPPPARPTEPSASNPAGRRVPATATRRHPSRAGRAARPGRRWWPFRRAAGPSTAPASLPAGPQTLAELEAERLRARGVYLAKAAELDEKIVEFNSYRPRSLAWLEKPRLLPEQAAHRFDDRCPPISSP